MGTFSICFVCTGNRCRSPIAEAWLRRYAEGLPVTVTSAGTLDIGAQAVPGDLLGVAQRMALDVSQHRSRSLTSLQEKHDLYLGFERGHAAYLVVETSVPVEKVFTLPEFLRLLDEADLPTLGDDVVEGARSRVQAAAAERRRQRRFNVPGEEIEDPFRGPLSGCASMSENVGALCQRVVQRLFGSSEPA